MGFRNGDDETNLGDQRGNLTVIGSTWSSDGNGGEVGMVGGKDPPSSPRRWPGWAVATLLSSRLAMVKERSESVTIIFTSRWESYEITCAMCD